MKNVVNLIGNLGNDPEIVNFENGGKIAKFSLATSQTWKNKEGEKQTETQWHNVIVPSFLADNIEKYCKKGMRIDLEGMIKYRTWEGDDGVKKFFTEIHARNIIFLSSISDDDTTAIDKMPDTPSNNEADDLPF